MTPLQLAFVAIICFSTTVAATRIAVAGLGAIPGGLGRIALGGLVAAGLLALRGMPRPAVGAWPDLLMASIGCLVVFPVALAASLAHGEAGSVAVGLAVTPLLTTAIGRFWDREPVAPRTWLATGVAVLALVVEGAWAAGGRLPAGAGWLALSAVAVAAGYAAGARAARRMPGVEVVAWAALVPALPAAALLVVLDPGVAYRGSTQSWLALVWIAAVAQVLGVVPWYAALARGGTARIGGLQILQPGLSAVAAWLVAGEPPRPATVAVLAGITAAVWWARPSPVAIGSRGPEPRP
jgi:drug/metabolite transporter (DMT)-like permease